MASEHVFQVSDANFESEILQSELPTVVDFWASWCGPCRAIAPAIDALAERFAGQIKVAKLNVDENPQTPSNYGIMSIPTLLMFRDGKLAEQLTGAVSRARLDAFFQQAIDGDQ
ncbi:MAG: thioredoxin [Bradymonadaceae bacterium]